MRPDQVDYSNKQTHYIDVSNGEILAGETERDAYLETGAVSDDVVHLGDALRQDVGTLPWTSDERPRMKWSQEEYVVFGKWIYAVAKEPDDPHFKRLTEDMLQNSRHLGIGPSPQTIRRVFGTLAEFYQEIEAPNTKKIGQFDDWSIEDFVAHIRNTETKGMSPAARDFVPGTGSPDYQYMKARFNDIGGFPKLLELAGYPVIPAWEKQDYIDWGVKFMQANDGVVPTSMMLQYMSVKKRGPSINRVRTMFDAMPAFHEAVIDEWRQTETERREERAMKISAIRERLQSDKLPAAMFRPGRKTKVAMYGSLPVLEFAARPDGDTLDADLLQAEVMLQLDPDEAIRLDAESRVLESLFPGIAENEKMLICRRSGRYSDYANFQAAVGRFVSSRKNAMPADAGAIEYEALILDVFDDIWPMDSHMETLRLGEDYKKYHRSKAPTKSDLEYELPEPVKLAKVSV